MKVQELAMMTVASTLLTHPVTARDHVRGPASAAVTLVEYGAYRVYQDPADLLIDLDKVGIRIVD
jgi:hypothetical protein